MATRREFTYKRNIQPGCASSDFIPPVDAFGQGQDIHQRRTQPLKPCWPVCDEGVRLWTHAIRSPNACCARAFANLPDQKNTE